MQPILRQLIPATFVFLWSSGFIIARYSMPYAEPITFQFLRFAGVLVVMVPVVLLWPPVWPTRRQILHIGTAGILLQACYLCCVWSAVRDGMSAGLVSLIVGLQPIITAWFAALLSERITSRQWIGLLLGLSGVGLVVFAKLSLTNMTLFSLIIAFVALASITSGTMFQKKYCPSFDLRAGSVIQFGAAALACLPMMFLLETREIQWNVEVIGSLLWGVLGISIGAISLLFIMIREGAATRVTSLLYLTPPTTAVMAWLIFDEPITLMTLMGTLLTVWGVWWVVSKVNTSPKTA